MARQASRVALLVATEANSISRECSLTLPLAPINEKFSFEEQHRLTVGYLASILQETLAEGISAFMNLNHEAL